MDRKVMITIVMIVVVGLIVGASTTILLKDNEHRNITYHANGGHFMNDESRSDDTVSNSSTALTEVYAKGNMKQFGWNTKADGTGTEVKAGAGIPGGVNDLYAVYSLYMIVDYSTGETITHIEDVSVTEIDLGNLNDPRGLGQCNKIDNVTCKMSSNSISKLVFKNDKATSISVYHDDILNVDKLKFQYADGALYILLSFDTSPAGSSPIKEIEFTVEGKEGKVDIVPYPGIDISVQISANFQASA